jgi:MiaB/RimO family radical SAM methylthiotransferase
MTIRFEPRFDPASAMKTFSIQTLGCKVNHYESEQVISLLRARGLVETTPDRAELRIINSCSVTVQAASQSRQTTRRMVRLPVLSDVARAGDTVAGHYSSKEHPSETSLLHSRVLVMGCWATSDKAAAEAIAGVDAVLTHHDNLAGELDRLLTLWAAPRTLPPTLPRAPHHPHEIKTSASAFGSQPETFNDNGWMMKAGSGAGDNTAGIGSESRENVNQISAGHGPERARRSAAPGANALPLLGEHQTGRQRAFLKIQDGCDAHCTYCIIPSLRPVLYSKPIDDAVEETQRLVAAGHVEIVLTGIFLGSYGQPTALRRRQPAGPAPLAQLVEALCTRVSGLRRLRLSSLEPGDLTDDLISVLRSHAQVVPHFHLPLQSGSDEILRRMNRQYRRDDFLRMIDRVNAAFDRPALTTDIIAGFPGEDDDEFARTVAVVEHSRFIHVHAFPYSPRPGTAAARWKQDFVHGPIVNQRIDQLRQMADEYSLRFRSQFVGSTVEVITEREPSGSADIAMRHGRCERYFAVHFDAPAAVAGEALKVRIDRVTPARTFGELATTL